MRSLSAKIVSIPEALALRERFREEGRTVVWTNGCYDLFHAGHALSMSFAREQGDVLFVGVSSDESVRQNKGSRRPIVPEEARVKLVAALEPVDVVVMYPDRDVMGLIEQIRPDVLVKGGDSAGRVMGQEFVEGYGGRVALSPIEEGISTSIIIERIRAAYDEFA